MERTDISRARRLATRTAAVALGSVVMLAAASATAEAHGGDTTRVHACVSKTSGAVRIVDAAAGGFNVTPDTNLPRPPVVVSHNLPTTDLGVPVGWRVEAFKIAPSTTPWTLVAEVICVPAS